MSEKHKQKDIKRSKKNEEQNFVMKEHCFLDLAIIMCKDKISIYRQLEYC